MEWMAFNTTREISQGEIIRISGPDGVYHSHVFIISARKVNGMPFCRVLRFKDPILDHPAMRAFSQFFKERNAHEQEKILRYLGIVPSDRENSASPGN